MQETSKANQRRQSDPLFFKRVFAGHGLDIGHGDDMVDRGAFPLIESCRGFELVDGDAQYITRYIQQQFDFVYSSHCLEHMVDPLGALNEWFTLVKPGGYFVIVVPDEDLYEQGVFPSRWNGDHKWTFTIHKHHSWSSRSLNIVQSISDSLTFFRFLRVALEDTGYDYSQMFSGTDQTKTGAEANIEVVVQKLGP